MSELTLDHSLTMSFAAENFFSQSLLRPHHGEAPQWDVPADGGPRDAVGDGPGLGCHSHYHHSHCNSTLQEVSLIPTASIVLTFEYFHAEFNVNWERIKYQCGNRG